ncbi:hypothetical protein BaRGS_00020077 [Batillaria attramentaria]|uniref:C2H2-type domain-containing protein n=1 Tax=Batillaria attramentaria TaxID=370345 RepID=A0ABD0KN49_9CAEN
MADGQENGLVAESGNHAVNGTTVVVTTPCINEGESEAVGEDILQQAFVEAEEFDQEAVAYPVHADTDVSASVTEEIDSGVVPDDAGLDSAPQIVTAEDGFATTTYTVVGTLPDGTISLPDELIAQAAEAGEQGVEVTEGSVIDSDGHLVTELPLDHEQHQLQETEQGIGQHVDSEGQEAVAEQQEPQTVRFALVSGNQGSGAPLGSSQNPIRIIQQGNQYTPVQQLTTEQLQQIMQVVQQQQLARNTQESGGSILFNPATNTRIVYRVIYPAELHKGQQILTVTPQRASATTVQSPALQTPKRQYRKRGREDEEDKVDGPEMSKEEKEERKKHRPRTRSGRVSKPPKHMVKDYKHIHVLDWDEDYDDSDGGYSDYKGSDEEGNSKGNREKSGSANSDAHLFSGLGSTRPKNFKCQTCDKSYIGNAGLGRHYRLNPSHGSLPEGALADREDGNEDVKTESGVLLNNTSSAMMTSTPGGAPAVAGSAGSSTGNLSEDSNTQDSIPSSTGAMSPVTTYAPRSHRGRGRSRGRWANYHHTAPLKRKQKLRDLIKTCEDEDLMEVVLPRLAKVINLWEFMLMKIEAEGDAHPRVDQIYQQFATLHKQLDDAALAQSLGFEAGTYEVKDIPVNEHTSFRYKYLTSDPNGPPGTVAEKRTIQVVTPDELVAQSPNKRQRVTSLLHPGSMASSSGMVPASVAASSLLTSIVTNSGLKGGVNKQPASHNVLRTVAVQQPQTSVLRTMAVQQPQAHVLRTVAIRQPHGNMPRTVAVGPTTPSKQGKRGQAGVVGVSLLSSPHSVSRTATSQPSGQNIIRTSLLASPQVVVSGTSVVASSPSEIPLSQAATSSSLSFLQQPACSINSDISAMAPMDFMDTSGDSPVSTASGLSSANTSGVVTMVVNSSMLNGDGADSSVKVNGVSEPVRLEGSALTDKVSCSTDVDGVLVTSAATMQENSLPVSTLSSAINSSVGTTSFIIKCENGEVYTVSGSEAEQFQQNSTGSGQLVASSLPSGTVVKTTAAINGQLNGVDSQGSKQEAVQSIGLDSSNSSSNTGTDVSHDQLLSDGGNAHTVASEVDETEGQVVTEEQQASIFQTEDGILIIQNPDGTTFQLQGAQGIPLETVQALLAMEGQFEPGDQIQTEIQQ